MADNDLQEFIDSQCSNTLRWYQKNLIDIYNDNWSYIIEAQLHRLFRADVLTKMMPFVTKEFNLFKYVVQAISQVYKSKAIRTVTKDGTPDEVYNAAVKDARIDSVMKQANRYANALRHCVVRPRLANDKLRYDLLTFDNVSVKLDEADYRRLIGVQYFTGLRVPDYDGVLDGSTAYGKVPAYTTGYKSLNGVSTYEYEDYDERHVWTIEMQNGREVVVYRRYQLVSSAFNTRGSEKLTEEKIDVYRDANGNAVLPFVLLSGEEPVTGMNFTQNSDIVDACIGIAILLVQLFHLIKLQSFKQVAISGGDNIPAQVISDPGSWFAMGKDSTANVLDLQSKFLDLWAAIKERITMVLGQFGVPPNDFLQNATAQSGFSKVVENAKLIERREQDIPRYEDYENELYRHTVMVWNTDKTGNVPAMQEGADFSIEFGEMGLPVDVQTIVQEETHDLLNSVISPIDIIMRRNPGLSREQALEKYAMNKAENGKAKMQTAEKPLTVPEVDEEPEEEDEAEENA